MQINEQLNLHPSWKQWKLARLCSRKSLHFYIRAIHQSQLNRPGQSATVQQWKPGDAGGCLNADSRIRDRSEVRGSDNDAAISTATTAAWTAPLLYCHCNQPRLSD